MNADFAKALASHALGMSDFLVDEVIYRDGDEDFVVFGETVDGTEFEATITVSVEVNDFAGGER